MNEQNNKNHDFHIINILLGKQKDVCITVQGTSMYPLLQENDKAVIVQCESYDIGDIIVFDYGNQQLLIHRVLMKTSNRYICKGDNAFGLEQICKDAIAGKVKSVIRGNVVLTLPVVDDDFIKRSIDVYREFKRNNFNKELTKKSKMYIDFANKYLSNT